MIAGRLPLVAAIAVSLALGLTAWRARTAAVGGGGAPGAPQSSSGEIAPPGAVVYGDRT